MELRHLRYFSAVAETRHFGRAAEHLHLAQPALSQSIRQLENELGVSLFTRTTRQVSLTPAGEFLQVEVPRILAAVEDRMHGVRRIAEGHHGLVRIAFTGSAAYTELPRIARLVRSELPGMALEIHADLLTPTQADGCSTAAWTWACCARPCRATGSPCAPSSSEPLVLAVPTGPPAGRRGRPSRCPTCARRTFVLFPGPDSAVNDAVMRSCPGAASSGRRARGCRHRGPARRWWPPTSGSPSCLRRCAQPPWRASCSSTSPTPPPSISPSSGAPTSRPGCRSSPCSRRRRLADSPGPRCPRSPDEDHPGRGHPLRHPLRQAAQVRQRRGPRRRARPGAGHHRRGRGRSRGGTAAALHLRRDAGRDHRGHRRDLRTAGHRADADRAGADPLPPLAHRRQPHGQVGPRHGDLGRPGPDPRLQRHRAARRLHRPDAGLAHAGVRRARRDGRRGRADAGDLRHHDLQGEGRTSPLHPRHRRRPRPARALRRRDRAVRRRQPRLVGVGVGARDEGDGRPGPDPRRGAVPRRRRRRPPLAGHASSTFPSWPTSPW